MNQMHVISIVDTAPNGPFPSGSAYSARCSCSWEAPVIGTVSVADEVARFHAREVASLYNLRLASFPETDEIEEPA